MADRDRDNKSGQGAAGKSSSPNPQGGHSGSEAPGRSGQSAPGGRGNADRPRDERGQLTEGSRGSGSRRPKGDGSDSDEESDRDESS